LNFRGELLNFGGVVVFDKCLVFSCCCVGAVFVFLLFGGGCPLIRCDVNSGMSFSMKVNEDGRGGLQQVAAAGVAATAAFVLALIHHFQGA